MKSLSKITLAVLGLVLTASVSETAQAKDGSWTIQHSITPFQRFELPHSVQVAPESETQPAASCEEIAEKDLAGCLEGIERIQNDDLYDMLEKSCALKHQASLLICANKKTGEGVSQWE